MMKERGPLNDKGASMGVHNAVQRMKQKCSNGLSNPYSAACLLQRVQSQAGALGTMNGYNWIDLSLYLMVSRASGIIMALTS